MIHNMAFVYENESIDEITQSILNILPEAEIEAEEAEGLLEDKIIILSGVVSKKRYTKTFFKTLLDSVDLEKLNDDLELKIDEKGNWFLRFDKDDALDEKVMRFILRLKLLHFLQKNRLQLTRCAKLLKAIHDYSFKCGSCNF